MPRTAYDEYMDELVKRMGSSVEGEKLLDVASAAAMMIGYALRESFDDPVQRLKTLNTLITFMTKVTMGNGGTL